MVLLQSQPYLLVDVITSIFVQNCVLLKKTKVEGFVKEDILVKFDILLNLHIVQYII